MWKVAAHPGRIRNKEREHEATANKMGQVPGPT
jgi:hypothetical protein